MVFLLSNGNVSRIWKFVIFGLTGIWITIFVGISIDDVPANAANQTSRDLPANDKPAGLVELQDENWWEKGRNNPVIHLIVDKVLQRVSVYSDGALISRSNVSSGKIGHETPGGIFSILSKNRIHHSNIYSRAPMPYMQRLTWSGIALHKSNSVPDYPASHGCVRLPGKFASRLFQFTQTGAQVIITNRDIRPRRIISPGLFEIGNGIILEASNLRPAKDVVSTAKPKRVPARIKPLRVLITRHSGRQEIMEIQEILNELKYSAGDVDGWMGPQTGKAIAAFQSDYRHKVTGSLGEELLAQLYRAAGKGKPKDGHVYVRQNYKALFDMPVVIADKNIPLGTHHFTAVYPEAVTGQNDANSGLDSVTRAPASIGAHWLALTIEQTGWPKQSRRKKKTSPNADLTEITAEEYSQPASSAERALERVNLPEELRQRISKLITPGSTIVIADRGFSRETGKGTDFIILTE